MKKWLLTRRLRLTVTLAVATAVAGAAAAPVSAARISWYDFVRFENGVFVSNPVRPLPDGDQIQLHVDRNAVDPGSIEIVLRTAPRIWSVKGVDIYRETVFCGGLLGYSCSPWLQFTAGLRLWGDDHGPTSRTIPLTDARRLSNGGWGMLQLVKGKLFHYPTGMYELWWDAGHAIGGTRYTFDWQWD